MTVDPGQETAPAPFSDDLKFLWQLACAYAEAYGQLNGHVTEAANGLLTGDTLAVRRAQVDGRLVRHVEGLCRQWGVPFTAKESFGYEPRL